QSVEELMRRPGERERLAPRGRRARDGARLHSGAHARRPSAHRPPERLVRLRAVDARRSPSAAQRSGRDPAAPAPNARRTVTARLAAAPGYESLAAVLDEALDQAQRGKGRERHAAAGEAFHDQQIVQLGEWMAGSTVFAVGQACKKSIESTRLEP